MIFPKVQTTLLAVALMMAPLALACGDDETIIQRQLRLRVFSATEGEGFPASLVDDIWWVRVRVYQNAQERLDLEATFDAREASGGLPILEFGENYQIVVEALAEDTEIILADGATPVFSYLETSNIDEIQVFVTPLGSTQYASALFASGGGVVSAPSEFEGTRLAQDFGLDPAAYGAQRAGHTVTALPDGRIVVIGGARMVDGGGDPFDGFIGTVEVFDPFTGYWTIVRDGQADPIDDLGGGSSLPALQLSVPRAFHTATYIGNDRIMVVGGLADVDNRVEAVSASEIIDIRKETMEVLTPTVSDLLEPRAFHSAHFINEQLIVIGGMTREYVDPRFTSSVEVFDLDTGFFDRALDANGDELSLLVGRGLHSGTTLADGIVVTGGRTNDGVTNTIEFIEFAPEGGLNLYFTNLASIQDPVRTMATARFGHSAVIMEQSYDADDGRDPTIRYLAIAGGYVTAETDLLRGAGLTDLVEFFDTWNLAIDQNSTVSMSTPRAHFQMVETTIRRDLLILGGVTNEGITNSIERLARNDRGGFPLAPIGFSSLNLPRAWGGAAILPTHDVIYVGGWDGSSASSGCGVGPITAGCTSEIANPGDRFNLGWLY